MEHFIHQPTNIPIKKNQPTIMFQSKWKKQVYIQNSNPEN